MAKQPTRNKATSPSRNKGRGGAKKAKASSEGAKAKSTRKPAAAKAVTPTEDAPADRKRPPHRAERQGTRRIHSRELTEAEAKEREEGEAARREQEIADQAEHRENLKGRQEEVGGWGARRKGRGQVREE